MRDGSLYLHRLPLTVLPLTASQRRILEGEPSSIAAGANKGKEGGSADRADPWK